MKTFLLRFEEKVLHDQFVYAENSLASIGRNGDSSETFSAIVAGTKTLTEVRRESVDDDPGSRALFAFPR